jgi:hypothetical protein
MLDSSKWRLINMIGWILMPMPYASPLCTGTPNEKLKAPVIAVIPMGGGGTSAIATLLESRLSQQDRYIVVDRERIVEMTKEWELADLSTAAAVPKRVKMGKLLGADFLVLLTEKATPEPLLEMVVSETSRGIRLRFSTMEISQAPEKDAAAMEAEIQHALTKRSEGFARICAVPPFMSMDLSRHHDHLKSAYARMLETMLLRIPGTQVVEIAEARQIAAETALTGSNVERDMPIYFLGEYRFDSANPDKPPYLRIIAKRGEQVIGTREWKDPTPSTAASIVRDSTMQLLAEATGSSTLQSDPKAESQILATRAKEYFSLGYYEECVQVAEASLLLEPVQPELHRLAMMAYSKWADQNHHKPVLEKLSYYDQAVVHMEQFFLQTRFQKDDSGIWGSLTSAFRETAYLANGADVETTKAVSAYRKRATNAYVRILTAKHQDGTLNDAMVRLLFDHWHNVPRHMDQPLQENLQQRLEVADMLLTSKIKNPHWYICRLIDEGIYHDEKRLAEYAWFLEQLRQRDHPAVEKGIEKLANDKIQDELRDIEKDKARQEAIRKIPNTDPTGPVDVEFPPLDIKLGNQKNFTMCGMLRCGENMDLLWGEGGIYLMKTKGVLERVFETQGTVNLFQQACFDGKYAWLPWISEPSQMLVIDTSDGSVTTFTGEDGLLPFRYAACAPIGQGRLCLSAGTWTAQTARTYIAVLELTQDKEKKFRIIHEAAKQVIPGDTHSNNRLDPQMAYIPKFMISEPKDDGTSWRALVNCGPTSLWIDPDAGIVKAVDAGTGGATDLKDVTFHDNAVYFGGLFRLKVETKERERLRELPENGSGYERVFIRNGQLHHVGWHWWVAAGIDKPLRKLQGKVPGRMYDIRQLFDSAHYGIILRTNLGSSDYKNYEVKFREGLFSETP